MRESQLAADQLVNEAKTRAKDTIEESEVRARQIIADMEERVKGLIDQYKKLESTRDDMLSELKRLASEVMEKVERSRTTASSFDPDKHLSTVRREAKKIAFPNHDYEKPPRDEKREAHEEAMQPDEVPVEPARKTQKSFFDEIG